MEFLFLIFDVVTNLTLFCLGVYFIYVGEVVQRFHAKRTNFAVYKETMSEYPTIQTLMNPYTNLALGNNYNITFHKDLNSI